MENAVTYIKQKSNIKPKIGIVLGSGLDMFCEKLDSKINISYNDIPNFRKTSIFQFIINKFPSISFAVLIFNFSTTI